MNDSPEIKITVIIVGMIAFLITLAVMYNAHRNYLIATYDNPLAMACALSDSDAKPCMAYMGSLK